MKEEFWNFSLQDVYWKLKEGEYSCFALQRKVDECDSNNPILSTAKCEMLTKKLTICLLSKLSSNLRKCLELTDVTNVTTSTQEIDMFNRCVSEPEFDKVVTTLAEKVSSDEFQSIEMGLQHRKLIDLDDRYTLDEEDHPDVVKNKFLDYNMGNFCQAEQKAAEECAQRQTLDEDVSCFKENSLFMNCSTSVLCGKHIRLCMQKNKNLGEDAYKLCMALDSMPARVQRCSWIMRRFLDQQVDE